MVRSARWNRVERGRTVWRRRQRRSCPVQTRRAGAQGRAQPLIVLMFLIRDGVTVGQSPRLHCVHKIIHPTPKNWNKTHQTLSTYDLYLKGTTRNPQKPRKREPSDVILSRCTCVVNKGHGDENLTTKRWCDGWLLTSFVLNASRVRPLEVQLSFGFPSIRIFT